MLITVDRWCESYTQQGSIQTENRRKGPNGPFDVWEMRNLLNRTPSMGRGDPASWNNWDHQGCRSGAPPMDTPLQAQASILPLTSWLWHEHAIRVKEGTKGRACDRGEGEHKWVMFRIMTQRRFPESCRPSPPARLKQFHGVTNKAEGIYTRKNLGHCIITQNQASKCWSICAPDNTNMQI